MQGQVERERVWPRKLRKAIGIYLCCIIVTLVALYGVLCIPRHIRREFSGVEVRMDGETSEILQTTDVRIDGWLANRPFTYPEFTGTFEISAYPQDDSRSRANLTKNFSGSLSYTWSLARISSPGVLYTDCMFSSIAINLFEVAEHEDGSASGTTGNRMIVAPATNLTEASDVLSQRHLYWMQNFTGFINIQPE